MQPTLLPVQMVSEGLLSLHSVVLWHKKYSAGYIAKLKEKRSSFIRRGQNTI